ncbi:substrate-binding domain-containing protein, partial [Streptomyces sp. NPDC087850]
RRAFRAAMRAHGLAGSARVLPGAHTEESGSAAGRLLLAGDRLPTAVFASNDRCAMGLMHTLDRAGVHVPREVSVVGYDDSHLSHLSHIDLSTVRQDPVRLAEHAVRFAVERLADATLPPREAVLEPRLVVRGTSAAPPARAD